jgi:hypothetical protein
MHTRAHTRTHTRTHPHAHTSTDAHAHPHTRTHEPSALPAPPDTAGLSGTGRERRPRKWDRRPSARRCSAARRCSSRCASPAASRSCAPTAWATAPQRSGASAPQRVQPTPSRTAPGDKCTRAHAQHVVQFARPAHASRARGGMASALRWVVRSTRVRVDPPCSFDIVARLCAVDRLGFRRVAVGKGLGVHSVSAWPSALEAGRACDGGRRATASGRCGTRGWHALKPERAGSRPNGGPAYAAASAGPGSGERCSCATGGSTNVCEGLTRLPAAAGHVGDPVRAHAQAQGRMAVNGA